MSDSAAHALAHLVLRGYGAQCADRLDEAEQCYRAALALNPETFDALHMLGVVRLQRGDAEEAARLLLAALPLLSDDHPPIYRNLGLCLAAVAVNRNLIGDSARPRQGRAYGGFLRTASLPALPTELPLVSIVLPCCDERDAAAAAVASIAEQTYRDIELIVVDSGPGAEGTSTLARQLASMAFPAQMVRRAGQPPPAALNDGIEGARGAYVGVIECNGRYRRDRVEAFVRALADRKARWGFSNVAFVDAAARPVRYGASPHVDRVMREFDALYANDTVGESIIDRDDLLVAGNLFFERSLWQQARGFPDFRHRWAWAFCLSALRLAEPVYFDEPAYVLRVPAGPAEDDTLAEETRRILAPWNQLTGEEDSLANAALRQPLRQRRRAEDFAAMKDGRGHELDRARLIRYAAELQFALPTSRH